MSIFPRISRAALALAALSVPALAACENDDDDAMSAEACDAYADFQATFFGDPAQMAPAAQALADAVPTAIGEETTAIATAVASGDPAAMENPEVMSALQVVGDQIYDDCDAEEKLDVSGVDYAFDELPDEIEAGRVAIRFTNESETEEPHELVLVTGADGQSATELAGLPIEELFQQARPLAVAFTNLPDQQATTLVDLTPGEYLVICTLPVGGFSDSQDGPPADPHSAHGMVSTLTVV